MKIIFAYILLFLIVGSYESILSQNSAKPYIVLQINKDETVNTLRSRGESIISQRPVQYTTLPNKNSTFAQILPTANNCNDLDDFSKKYLGKNGIGKSIRYPHSMWSFSKAVLTDLCGLSRPSNRDIYTAMDIIAKTNGYNIITDCEKGLFSGDAIQRDVNIVLPETILGAIVKSEYLSKSTVLLSPMTIVKPTNSSSQSKSDDNKLSNINTTTVTPTEQSTTYSIDHAIDVVMRNMTIEQMISRPCGIFDANTVGMKQKDIKAFLASQKPNWKITENAGGDLFLRKDQGFNMRYHGIIPNNIQCSFYSGYHKKGLSSIKYYFYFESKDDVLQFAMTIVNDLNRSRATLKSLRTDKQAKEQPKCEGFLDDHTFIVWQNVKSKYVSIEIYLDPNPTYLQ